MTPAQRMVAARLDNAERALTAEMERGDDWIGAVETAGDWREIYELGQEAGFRGVPMPELFRTGWNIVMDGLKLDPRNIRRIAGRDAKSLEVWETYATLTREADSAEGLTAYQTKKLARAKKTIGLAEPPGRPRTRPQK